MRTVRKIAAAFVASATLLSGCDSPSERRADPADAASPSASPTPTAKDVLSSGVRQFATAPYTYTMKLAQGDFSGAVDPATGTKSAKVSRATGTKFTLDTIIIGGDYFFKVTSVPLEGVDPKKWYKLDRSKVTKDVIIGFAESKDPTNSGNFLAAVVSAERPEPTRITGTLDLSKAGDLGIRDPRIIADLGDRAKAAPFEATLDDRGKITAVAVTIPPYGNAPESRATVAYANHGVPLTVTAPPPAEVAAAPAAVYTFLN